MWAMALSEEAVVTGVIDPLSTNLLEDVQVSLCLTLRRCLHYFRYSDSSSKDSDSSDVITLFLSSGSTVFAEIQGVIDACIKLSGMPDLSLSFMVSSPAL